MFNNFSIKFPTTTIVCCCFWYWLCVIAYAADSATDRNPTAKFRFTINLPATKHYPALDDINSLDFRLVGHEITDRIIALFQDYPGSRNVTVEKFQEHNTGVIVTVHLLTSQFINQTEIESRIQRVLDSGYLGRVRASADGFKFEATNEFANKTMKWQCAPDNYYWCGDGSCIPMSGTCNGIMECPDGIDELNCDTLVKVEARPENLTAKAGHRAEFFCGSVDFKHRVKWYRNGVEIDDFRTAKILQKKGRLQIVRLTKEDEGPYTCTAENSLPGSSMTVHLTVLPQPVDSDGNATQRFAMHAEDPSEDDLVVTIINTTEGSSAQLICGMHPEDKDVTVNWTRVDGDLPAGSAVTGPALDIPVIRLHHAGFYECRPSFAEPDEEPHSVAQIVVHKPPSLMRSLILRRRFSPRIAPENLTINEGDPFLFRCFSTKPDFNVEWGRPLTAPMPSNIRIFGGNLSSSTSELSDAGKYFCNHRTGKVSERTTAVLTVLPRK